MNSKKDDDFASPLFVAVEYDDVLLVEELLSSGADINETGLRGNKAYHLCESVEMAEFFISKGVDVFGKNDFGQTLLHSAAVDNALLVEFLIKKSAEINVKDSTGAAPIIYANTTSIIDIMLENGADIDSTDEDGDTPLLSKVFGSHKEIVEHLLARGADVNKSNKYGQTPLHWASCDGIAEMLTDENADIESKDDEGKTPLESALDRGVTEVICFLRKRKKANTDLDSTNRVALHVAAFENSIEPLRRLLECGADANGEDWGGFTPLCYAQSSEAAELLVSHGGNLHETCQKKCAPLHFAAWKRNLKLVEYLINKGINPNIKDSDGSSALHLTHSPDMADFLINHGADICALDDNGNTPLHRAVKKGKLELVEYLANNGADIHARNYQGCTPLHFTKTEDVTRFLIERGANLNSKDEDGDTPLHMASLWGVVDVVKFLIETGSDINAKNNENETPLDYAIVRGNKKVVEIIRRNLV
jgi:ankyrin repeat protein